MMYNLKLCDIVVAAFSTDDDSVHVYVPKLMPPSTRYIENNRKLYDRLKDWIASRILTLSRSNADKLYNLFGMQRSIHIEDRFRISLIYNAISIHDCYWVCSSNDNRCWCDVDLRKNKLVDVMNIALLGECPSFRILEPHADRMVDGMFPKAWTEINGKLSMLKGDNTNGINVYAEVYASRFFEYFNIQHVEYQLYEHQGRQYSICNLMNQSNEISFLPAQDIIDMYENGGRDYNCLLESYIHDFANMVVSDYLIANTDRHTFNYMWRMDNTNGQIIGMAPLFDHNQAFISDAFDLDVSSKLSPTFQNLAITMFDSANMYFHKSIFLTKRKSDFDGLAMKYQDNIIKRFLTLKGESDKE